MSRYETSVIWRRERDEPFVDNKYSRGHEWVFDGGATVQASSSPHIVPCPYSVEEHVDPEEAFIAALSSCHMLVFLAIAAKNKFVVDSYVDNAVGVLEKNSEGSMAITRVTLNPTIEFSGESAPNMELLEELHQRAHKSCFIANSVKTEVVTTMQVADGFE